MEQIVNYNHESILNYFVLKIEIINCKIWLNEKSMNACFKYYKRNLILNKMIQNIGCE